MTVKDLSFWGWVKLSLIIDFLIPLLLMPILLIVALVAPEKITINWSQKFNIYGINLDVGSGDLMVGSILISDLFIGFIGLMIQSGILYFFAQKSPLGHVKIGA